MGGEPWFNNIAPEEAWMVQQETAKDESGSEPGSTNKKRMAVEWAARDVTDFITELAHLCDLVVTESAVCIRLQQRRSPNSSENIIYSRRRDLIEGRELTA